MHILLTGSSGLIGSELSAFLSAKGHRILHMVRHTPGNPDQIQWNPVSGIPDMQALESLDGVIHLAGENIAAGRWTAAKKERIRNSRIQGTLTLSKALSRLFDPPKVLISVSAIGYYGDRGEELLDEECDPGSGFLPQLCQEWEAATEAAVIRGIRVVLPRLGMVLSTKGGSLPRMLPLFRLGLGGEDRLRLPVYQLDFDG